VLRGVIEDSVPFVSRGARDKHDQRRIADIEDLVRDARPNIDEIPHFVNAVKVFYSKAAATSGAVIDACKKRLLEYDNA